MKKSKAIKKILNEFNFEKVHIAMDTLNWYWFDTDGKAPSIYRLKETAKRLLKDIDCNKEYHTIASGGFEASYIGGELSLRFIVSDCGEEININR
jgi:hypothetical protein